MGNPPPNCRHRLRRSLLDGANPWAFRAGYYLDLGAPGAARARAEEALREAGCATPEALRARVHLLPGRWVCRPVNGGPPEAERPDPALTALLLALCGPQFYAPDRPLVWTESRLARRLWLFRPTAFYLDLPA